MTTLELGISSERARDGAGRFIAAAKGAGAAARKTGKDVGFLDGSMDKAGKTASRAGGTIAKVFAGISATLLARKALSEIIDFEKGLVGVGKTADLSGQDLRDFGSEIIALSTAIPVATGTLLDIGQAAGQLGVKGTDNILKFTDTVAKLGVASNLQGDAAATALARLLNVTGENIQSVDKLGSVIVRLGNNFATTEAEIADSATGVAQAGAIFAVSSAEAAALGASLSSLGVAAQLGGSSFGRLLRAVDNTVREGGARLKLLADVSGRTGEAIQFAFANNATDGAVIFLEALKKFTAEGGQASAFLSEFGLEGEQVLKVLPTLAKNVDLVNNALGQARDELINTNALNQEAERGFDTLGSEVTLLGNVWDAVVLQFRNSTGPLRDVIRFTADLIRSFVGLDDQITSSISAIETARTAIIGLGAIAGTIAAFTALSFAVGAFVAAIGFVASPLGIVLVSIGAIASAIYSFRDSLIEVNGTVFTFGDFLSATWEVLAERTDRFAERIFNPIKRVFAAFGGPVEVFSELFLKTLAGIGLAIDAVVDRIKTLFDAFSRVDFSNPITIAQSVGRLDKAFEEAFNPVDIYKEFRDGFTEVVETDFTATLKASFGRLNFSGVIGAALFENELFAEIAERAGKKTAESFREGFLASAEPFGLEDFSRFQAINQAARTNRLNRENDAKTDSVSGAAAGTGAGSNGAPLPSIFSGVALAATAATEAVSSLIAVAARLADTAESTGRRVGSSVGQALNSAATDFEKIGGIFESLFRSITQTLFDELFTRRVEKSVSDFVTSAVDVISGTESLKGNVFQNASVIPHQLGGVISSPVAFPLAGGNIGTAVEDGRPEGILPLERDSKGRLGVSAVGSGETGGNTVINFNVRTPNADSFRRSRRQIARDLSQQQQAAGR